MPAPVFHDEIRPMNDDLLLLHRDFNDVSGSQIKLIDESADKYTSMFFEVLRTGPQASEVKVGDVVWVAWRRLVPPFIVTVNGMEKNVTITSEQEVLAIVGKIDDNGEVVRFD